VYRRLARPAQLRDRVAELDDLCRDAAAGLEESIALQAAWQARRATIAVPPLALPSRTGWVSLPLTGPDGRSFSMVVDPAAADPLAVGLAAGAAFDQALIELMLQIAPPGSVVVDIGAHLGQFSLPAAAAGCRVLAVEASPLNAALLRASALENGFTGLRVLQVATSDRPGTLSFQPDGPFGHVAVEGDDGPTVSVPAVAMDDVVAELGLSPVAFVKIDVEGSELPTLAGMAGLLSQPDAPPVLVESNGHTLAKFGATPRDLLVALEGFGYTAHIVEAQRLVEVRSTDFQPQTIVDYLALKGLPAGIDRIEVRPSLTLEERVARVAADARLPNPDHRAWIGAALAEADPELLAHPEVVEVLAALSTDPVDRVQAATAWWAAGRRP
jgi:FkbM family methyltransferase